MTISKYKPLTEKDIFTSTIIVHEAIPITGTIGSGTYEDYLDQSQTNNKTYNHGLFMSTYDYPYMSASANHIFDTIPGEISGTYGVAFGTGAIGGGRALMYDSLTAQLAGPGSDGQILAFDRLGNMGAGLVANQMTNWVGVDFSRLTHKDGIEKGSFRLQLKVANSYALASVGGGRIVTIFDTGSVFQGPAGEYSVLYSGNVGTPVLDSQAVGLLYYQSAIAIIQPTAALISGTFSGVEQFVSNSIGVLPAGAYWSWTGSLASASSNEMAHGLLHRIFNISFNNNVEINSTKYVCRATSFEFNYSSNPTFTDPTTSGVRTRQNKAGNYSTALLSRTGITKIGLYDAANRLLAVASPSRVISKNTHEEPTFTLRLDY